jgi:hypothetical protein
MENKYSIPNYKDFKIGEEFIFSYRKTDNLFDALLSGEYWNIPIIENIDIFNYIRIPHLTKEQIENEGWIYKETITYSDTKENLPDADKLIFAKDDRLTKLTWKKKDNFIQIYIDLNDEGCYELFNTTDLFLGECPSINELRYICKLLKI